jgi:hypothetical protein
MNDASNIIVAYTAAIGLSALISAPAGAQSRNLAPVTQPGLNIGPSGTVSITVRPLSEPAMTSAKPVSGWQPAPPISVTTRALLPGHWALHGPNYVWVPPETRLRELQTAALVQGGYVWRNGSHVWMPTHYAEP